MNSEAEFGERMSKRTPRGMCLYQQIKQLITPLWSVKSGFHLDFCAFCCSSWFFLARFCFSSSDVRCCFLLLFVAFCCFSLLFVAPRCSFWLFTALLLISTTFYVGPELVRMNDGNEKCSLLLFVARFGFWYVFSFGVRCLLLFFVALSCF